MVDEQALMELVKINEPLYNREHENYSNTALRENIWREIANDLGVSVYASVYYRRTQTSMRMNVAQLCKDKWTRIRDNFRKALLLRKQWIDSGAKCSRPPKHYNRLSFLLPYLKDDNFHPLEKDIEDKICEEECSDSSLSNPTPRKVMKRSASIVEFHEENEEGAERTEEVLVYESQPGQSRSESDPVLTEFFVNMANTVARFPVKKQLKIKQKLFQMVFDVELELADNERDTLF
ncbi:transcription factor Adf-1-like isoform X1 [Plodia interpunctella]|uniref:transcription factor Adf-1-like isoform X1 n=1 Tax=Plodia interpunctella TaxID=58824 RepID=UPI00236794DF|nr:transcription factor Adf-1-like isoform X1 [Plodia interpunctella]